MKNFVAFILVLIVATLACDVQVPYTPTPTPVISATPTESATVTAYQSLHVRTARMGTRIDYLYHGDIVTLTGTCDHGWAEIQWKGGTAWVNADYLSPNKCSE